VINSDDIKYSGATNIPDLLRRVAGVDVMTITARDQQVGVRGFVDPLSNKLLVLIDGCSVYINLYNHVFWDAFPVGLEEIDRIEVVKSPASALYGANAYSGVINIITKSPQQLKGTTFHLTAGTQNTLIGSFIYAGETAKKKISGKVSAQWERTDEWNDRAENGGKITRFNALIRYKPNHKSRLALSAGRVHIKDRKLFTNEFTGAGRLSNQISYLQLDVEYSNLRFRTFLRSEKSDEFWWLLDRNQGWETSVYDAELQHTVKPGKGFSLVWGINYRYHQLKKHVLFPEDHHQNLWALFLENEFTITGRWRLTLGGRYDWHPLVRGRFSPRGNISYSPTRHHMIRLSVARAFLNPSFAASYMYMNESLHITLDPPLPPITLPITFTFWGNPQLKPEGITSYEIGYHSNWSNHLKLNLNLFYNQYHDFLIQDFWIIFYQEGEIFPGSPGGIFPKLLSGSNHNGGDAWGIGGEMSLDVSLNQWISGFVNYSFQQITDKADNPYTTYVNEKDRGRSEFPKHKINAGLRVMFKNGFSLNILAHWVDQTQRFIVHQDYERYLSKTDDYFIFNTRVGYTFWKKKADVVLSIFNLFNNHHYEYPTGLDLPIPNSDRIGRKITFTVRVKF
jgi:iron complex outermembrane receptor protein